MGGGLHLLGTGPGGRGDVARVGASRQPRLRGLRTRRRAARLRGRFAARGRGGCGAGSVRGWRVGGALGDLSGGVRLGTRGMTGREKKLGRGL